MYVRCRSDAVNFVRKHAGFGVVFLVLVAVPEWAGAGDAAPSRPVRPPAEGAAGTTAAAPPANQRVAVYLQQQPFASRASARPKHSKPAAPGSTLLWGRVVLYLCVLGGILWGALYLAKKYLPGGRQLFASPGVEILGRTHLDARRYVALVRVGGRVLVVGVGPDDMTSLSEISDSREVAELLETVRPKSPAGQNLFQRLFHKHLAKNEERSVETEAISLATHLGSRLGTLQERVKALREAE